MTVSRDNLSQIMSIDATKAKTILRLAEHWNISMEEIVAFGDDLNDIDMIEACGMGIAMGNALEEVKKKADYICDTNDNDGIAKWLLAMNYSNFNITEEWPYINNYEMVDFNHHHIDAEKLYAIVNSHEDVNQTYCKGFN